MPDPIPNPDPAPQTASAPPAAQRGPTINIGREFGTAQRKLPPAKILLTAMAAVLVIVGIASFLQRAKPQAAGSLDNVAAVAIPGQTSVLTALTFSLRNPGQKSLWVHNIAAKLVTPSGEQTADAVSAVDFARYYQAFPSLAANAQPALSPEDKLQPGEELKRTVIVSFSVSLESFNQRKSLSVVVQPYDQPLPVMLTR
ncbi:MAG: hypothetical protein WAN65_07190 [Candidatus Sulfotelmatobacter sp.]